MKREMDRLRASWNTKLEIATRDAESQARVKREQEQQAISELRQRNMSEQIIVQPHPPARVGEAVRGDSAASVFTWKELESRFGEIEERAKPPQNVQADFIRTQWDSGSVSQGWIVSGDPILRNEFECLCAIAARKLGCAAGDHLHEEWLGLVREWTQHTGLDRDHRYVWHSTGSVTENGATGTTQGWSSEEIAELSARYCTYLMAQNVPESTAPVSKPPEAADGKSVMSPRSVKPTKAKRPKRRDTVIFGAIQAGLKGPKYCALLDQRNAQLPSAWTDEGCPDTYAEANRSPKWRKRIQDEKCRYRRVYEKLSAQEREAIIQSVNGTRRTRD
jgi:hypothetical protein